METLDEFDNEYPLSITFCRQISPEDFEEQSVSYTRQCLQELYAAMEQNPWVCERALRKQKQVEKEEAGLFSYIKAKIFWTLQGELNYSNYMDIAEMREKVCQLRRDMKRVNNYAQGAKTRKGRHTRHSWGKMHTLGGGFSPLRSKAPEPPKITMPRVFGPFPKLTNQQVDRTTVSSPDLKFWWNGTATLNQKRLPGSDPTPPPQNAGSNSTKPAASVFNTTMTSTFQGGAEDDMDDEKPGPSSSAKET
ncbi:uncharacterized protein [Anas acuta]|uniref:uncharacterized protein n=1 Tax=Anas acuta TaxID=28680 RepID=UPI0035C8EB97